MVVVTVVCDLGQSVPPAGGGVGSVVDDPYGFFELDRAGAGRSEGRGADFLDDGVGSRKISRLLLFCMKICLCSGVGGTEPGTAIGFTTSAEGRPIPSLNGTPEPPRSLMAFVACICSSVVRFPGVVMS